MKKKQTKECQGYKSSGSNNPVSAWVQMSNEPCSIAKTQFQIGPFETQFNIPEAEISDLNRSETKTAYRNTNSVQGEARDLATRQGSVSITG
jgi:hypothetical protein